MLHNIFAYTEPSPTEGYPGYISINRDEKGVLSITVRSPGNEGRNVANLPIDNKTLLRMGIDALTYSDPLDPELRLFFADAATKNSSPPPNTLNHPNIAPPKLFVLSLAAVFIFGIGLIFGALFQLAHGCL